MNEVLRAIAQRYSCRDFTGAPLTESQIHAIAQAAVAAPSAMNRQPWRVIVITDKTLIDEFDADALAVLAAMEDQSGYERIKSRGGKVFYNAPCMIMVLSDGSDYADMDCGILSQNMALAAHSLGLGSVICGMAAVPLAGPRGDQWKERMGFPGEFKFGIAVLAGAAKTGKAPHEPDREKITYIP